MSSRVTSKDTPSGRDSGRQLGRELRKLRQAAGITQNRAAEWLGCRQAKINKIESSLVRISRSDLDRLLELYEVDPGRAESLRALAKRQPARRSVDSPPLWRAYEDLTDRELDAQAIFSWHSEGIPVPLCSEAYMLQRVGHHPGTAECVTELLRRRKARSKILFDEGALDYQTILSESALRRMPGGHSPELVVDQMEHMIYLIKSSHRLTLRILPFAAPLDFVDSDFILLRFPPEIDEKDFAYIEYVSGARNISNASELESFEEHWSRLQAAALSPIASLEFIELVMREARDDMRRA